MPEVTTHLHTRALLSPDAVAKWVPEELTATRTTVGNVFVSSYITQENAGGTLTVFGDGTPQTSFVNSSSSKSQC